MNWSADLRAETPGGQTTHSIPLRLKSDGPTSSRILIFALFLRKQCFLCVLNLPTTAENFISVVTEGKCFKLDLRISLTLSMNLQQVKLNELFRPKSSKHTRGHSRKQYKAQ